ncbi:LPXTG cell wall anchor domain-containing protein [Gordonibacter sp. An230]|uniref:LPXTG cell wall anchor domain-containing protein n=1 Tax=Gordonibacter sp. An230 TaxID=1965592 RepID=UPI0011216FBF|nr:LPXTG cell wall anchor domain-containing protein [Gordonibacter sp. An230]
MERQMRGFKLLLSGALVAVLALGSIVPMAPAYADEAVAIAAAPEVRGDAEGGDGSNESCEHLAGEWQAMLVNSKTNEVDEFFAINLVGDANAKLRINPDNAAAPSLSLSEGTLIVEGGLGIDWSNDAYLGPYGWVSGYQMGNIPLRVPEGKKLASLTLTIISVDESGYVSRAVLTPVYALSDTVGAVVTDKNAPMDIPLLNPTTGEPDDIFSATGILDGANVPEGAHVYLAPGVRGDWMEDGVITVATFACSLVVNGQTVTDDFGTITLTIPACFDKQLADGKVRTVTVETSEGEKWSDSIKMTEDATLTATMTKYGSELGRFEVTVAVGDVVDDGSQGGAPAPQPPTVEAPAVSGGTGITASGALSGANIPEGAQVALSAAELSAGDADYDRLVAAMGAGELAGVYEVSMFVNGSEVHDGFGELTLTMPVDEAYNGHWVTVWHLHADGSITSERVVAENGGVTFTVSDLSTFALEIGELAEDGGSEVSTEDKLPQTGDSTAILGILAVSGAALSGAGAFISRRKNGIR